MNTYIINAIKEQKLIRFLYEGGFRIIEPYAYGITPHNKEVIRGWQTDGSSNSGKSVGWKLFEVSKMDSIMLLTESFNPSRIGYRRGDTSMRSIICEV